MRDCDCDCAVRACVLFEGLAVPLMRGLCCLSWTMLHAAASLILHAVVMMLLCRITALAGVPTPAVIPAGEQLTVISHAIHWHYECSQSQGNFARANASFRSRGSNHDVFACRHSIWIRFWCRRSSEGSDAVCNVTRCSGQTDG